MNLKIYAERIEETALEQVHTLLAQDAFKNCKVRIMPDVHAGAGCVIGFTADLGDKVIPDVVGVDIGCGVRVVELGKVDIDLPNLDAIIRACVPSGRNVHEFPVVRFPDLKLLHCYDVLSNIRRIECSLGTLGSGNHFCEVDADEDGVKYLVIHTGSRNLGKQVAEYYQSLAVNLMHDSDNLALRKEQLIREYKASGRNQEINAALRQLTADFRAQLPSIPDNLCYLIGKYREMYLHDMYICQDFARVNRERIANIICQQLHIRPVSVFESVHNYIDKDLNMVRKGAISAQDGERVIIPINMRDGSIIGVGKGNKDWNFSAPHGAGRLMSRAAAKARIDMTEFAKSMDGIYTTSVCLETLDEAPMAYKSMDEIVRQIEPTVRIEKIIKPIYNFKASE